MAKYEQPKSNRDRLTFLKRSAVTGPQDAKSGNPYVSQSTLVAIIAFLPDFETAVNAVSEKMGARSKEVRERAAAIERIGLYARDLWAVLKRRASRLDQPAEVLTFYQLPLDGTIPKPTSQEQWLTLAAQVVKGDADAVAAGYPAMINPSAAELQAVLDAARSESDDVAMADRAYDKAQEAIAALRAQADELISEMMAETRYLLRKKDAAGQRRIQRTYGATFTYLKGEPIDADDVAAQEAAEEEAG